jgi:hypothetical protein
MSIKHLLIAAVQLSTLRQSQGLKARFAGIVEMGASGIRREDGMSELLMFYEAQHRDWRNRVVHHGSHLLAVCGIVVCFMRPVLGLGLMVAALPISWLGHAIFEHNTPAFFDQTDRGGIKGGARKKLAIALGGIVWSGACALRLFGLGPLSPTMRRLP